MFGNRLDRISKLKKRLGLKAMASSRSAKVSSSRVLLNVLESHDT